MNRFDAHIIDNFIFKGKLKWHMAMEIKDKIEDEIDI